MRQEALCDIALATRWFAACRVSQPCKRRRAWSRPRSRPHTAWTWGLQGAAPPAGAPAWLCALRATLSRQARPHARVQGDARLEGVLALAGCGACHGAAIMLSRQAWPFRCAWNHACFVETCEASAVKL